jgi:hypothetical protein
MICAPRLKHCSDDQITRKIRWAEHVARMGEWRGAYRGLVGKREGKETTWKTRP